MQVRVFVEVGRGGSGGAGNGDRLEATAALAFGAAAVVAAPTASKNAASQDESTQYDEALRFCGESGEPLAGVHYTLYFASGISCSGITDDDGMTERICTCEAEEIVKAVLEPPSGSAPCCTLQGGSSQDEVLIELEGVKTNLSDVGQSRVEVRAKGHKRDLTPGELEITRRVFS